MRKQRAIRKTIAKISIHDLKSDFAYWQAQPYAARLAALEEIRREYHQRRYGVQPRFQRVYGIVMLRKLKKSKKKD